MIDMTWNHFAEMGRDDSFRVSRFPNFFASEMNKGHVWNELWLALWREV